jgi:hypothetical protein
MSGNGNDNAHNNQFGGGERGPTGGVKGGPTGLGGSGQGGGWGWKYEPGKKEPFTDAAGTHIVISGGWQRVPAGNNNNGKDGGVHPGDDTDKNKPVFRPDGSFMASVDGFIYHVTLDGSGKASGVTKVSEPERTGAEKLQIAVANANHRKPEEMFPQLDRSKTEPLRQARARQQAEEAWKGTPAKSGEYDENVEGFTYHVRVNPAGQAESVTLTREPERSGAEKLKIAVANANHRKPEEMFPELDRSKGEPGRQARARQQAEGKYLSSPENQARIRREQELKRQQEALRHKQEEEARQKEAARKLAEETLKKLEAARQAAESRVHAPGMIPVRGFPAAASVSLAPLRYGLTETGSVTLAEEVATAVRQSIMAALAELDSLATASLAGPVGIAVATLFYSPELGKGSDQVRGGIESRLTGLMPADTLRLPDETTLRRALVHGQPVAMPVRGLLEVADGVARLGLVRTPTPGAVQVAEAGADPITGYYAYTLPAEDDVPARTILVSPADAPGASGPTILTGPVPLPEIITHTGGAVQPVQSISTTEYPCPDDVVIRDIILVFPAGSGLKPVYVMLNSPRSKPGVVSGHGQPVGSHWLAGASEGEGAPVPSQIADKLRGKRYSSFDAFRLTFWKTVAADPELRNQFKTQNKGNIDNGNSPFTHKSEQVGERKRYELHHVTPVSQKGAIYDVDNIMVFTPKRHIEAHKGGN